MSTWISEYFNPIFRKIILISFEFHHSNWNDCKADPLCFCCINYISIVFKWKWNDIVDFHRQIFSNLTSKEELARFACENFQYENISIWMKLLQRNNEIVQSIWLMNWTPSCSCFCRLFPLFFFQNSSFRCRLVAIFGFMSYMQKWQNLLQYFCIICTTQYSTTIASHHLWLCGFFFSPLSIDIYLFSSIEHMVFSTHIKTNNNNNKKTGKSSLTFSLVSRNDSQQQETDKIWFYLYLPCIDGCFLISCQKMRRIRGRSEKNTKQQRQSILNTFWHLNDAKVKFHFSSILYVVIQFFLLWKCVVDVENRVRAAAF